MNCPLFVELCAGTAAVSLRLHRDGARPPVSRMGAKTGYASTILRVLGLIPGQGAERYLWCEPDPGVRLLLEAYRDGALARAAAEVIRGWADEDPRALWERLRAEGPPQGPPADAREVARWLCVHRLTIPQAQVRGAGPSDFNGGKPQGAHGQADDLDTLPTLPAAIADDARRVDPREVARLFNVAPVAARPDGVHVRDRHVVAGRDNLGRLSACTDGPNVILGQDGGGVLDPNLRGPVPNLVADVLTLSAPFEVVGAVVGADSVLVSGDRPGGARAVEGSTDKGADPPVDTAPSAAHDKLVVAVLVDAADERPVGVDGPDEAGVADLVLGGLSHGSPFNHMDTSAATISYGSEDVKLPTGVIVYIDPSYVGTTGYAADLPRAEVVALARRWAAAGATVCISEAEPIGDLVAEGWYQVRIDGERTGQKRTFSRQQAEWLTMNRAPAWRPSVQGALFGGA